MKDLYCMKRVSLLLPAVQFISWFWMCCKICQVTKSVCTSLEVSVANSPFYFLVFSSIWSSTDTYPSHMGRGHTKARKTQGKLLLVKKTPTLPSSLLHLKFIGHSQWGMIRVRDVFSFCQLNSNMKTWKIQALIHSVLSVGRGYEQHGSNYSKNLK